MRSLRARGFTLIEIMIAVAVVALLAAIAYPSYQESILRSKRSEGKAALLKIMQLEERFYTVNNRYTDQLGELFGRSGATVGSNDDSINGYYTISASSAPTGNLAQSVTLTAAPGNTNAAETREKTFADPDATGCGSLSLTSTGIKSRTGTADMKKCW